MNTARATLVQSVFMDARHKGGHDGGVVDLAGHDG